MWSTSLKNWVRGIAIVGGLVAGQSVFADTPNGYTLYWGDEFNLGVGKQASSTWWGFNTGAGGWGNAELENYTNALANSQIVADTLATDGLALRIQAIKAGTGYTSARLITQNKVNLQYGFIEARIRMPYGQGIWPAFWMLGKNISTVGWPACGEADIMENIGNVPNTNWGSLHAPSFDPSVTWVLNSPAVYHSAYHLFQASWTPNSFTFFVDGVSYHSENINNDPKWPFNAPMFFLLNVAVGGNWPGKPDKTTIFPQNMWVDYVRLYHLAGVPSNEVVSLFASANNKFISAENAGANPLDCNRTVASGWEQFLVVDLGSGQVALQSQANKKYVAVSSGSTPSLIANATAITSASTFQLVPNSNGTIYLKSIANGKYVTIDATKTPPAVVASASAAGVPTAFGITCYGQLAAPGAPGIPASVKATPGAASATVTWTAVTGAKSYEIYVSTNPGGAGMKEAGTFTGTSGVLTGLSPTTTYSVAVAALGTHGMSLRSKIVTVKPSPAKP